MAFLSDQVQVYEEVNGRLQQTDIRRRPLSSQLVAQFRREVILKDVLQARTPTSTVALNGPESALCRDILRWGLQLTAYFLRIEGRATGCSRCSRGFVDRAVEAGYR